MAASYTQSLRADGHFLNLPVKNFEDKVIVRLMLDGQMVREFDIELARQAPPDWWAYYDISAFAGQNLTLEIEGDLSGANLDWLREAICVSAEPLGLEELYAEPYRPQFHFSTRRGWHNDPNGLVYHDGEWHMFYQHNPFGVRWGNMHWGHAVSPDLTHWQELPTALYQRGLGDMIFSGGGLVDETNSAGLAGPGKAPLVVAFTSTGRGECLAYSTDRGRTLVEYAGNPVLVHEKDGRDPKILRYGDGWVMIVYEELVEGDPSDGSDRGYAFYTSKNLKDWQRTGFLPGYFECPELYELPVEGGSGEKRWVISACVWQGSRSACALGRFDGRSFTTEEMTATSHYGPHFYAAQVFSHAPAGRVIMVGWMSGAHFPDMPFSQAMTVPLELTLRRTPEGHRLCYWPVKELEVLRSAKMQGSRLTAEAANNLLAQANHELLDVELALRARGDLPVKLNVRGHPITWDPAASTLTFAGVTAPLPGKTRRLSLRVLVDRSVTEVFADQGAAAFASLTVFEDPALPLRLEGPAAVEEMAVYPLRSIW